MPSPSRRATHGWLNQTASIGPVSSATFASTRRPRRLRIGRVVTLRTVTATAARSPGRRSATFLPARSACSRGRWASRSPTVSIPSEASALPALPASSPARAAGWGAGSERSSASSFSSSVLAKAVAMCR